MANEIDNPQLFNQQLCDALAAHGDGILKEASEAATKMTRRKLREDAFSPAIIPHEDITNSDLDRFLDREDPGMICEMEPDSMGAKTISFDDTPDTAPYYGDKYLLVFYSNTTPEFTKDVNFLRTYRMDLREVITDNALRDLSRQKDHKFMAGVNKIVGSVAGAPSPLTGLQQNVRYAGRLNRNNWVSSTLLLGDHDLLNGVFLCNRRTFAELRRWGRNEMGGDFSQELNKKGSRAFETAEFSDIKFIVTMKSDLVPNGAIYEFTEPNYLGRAGVLQKPTMYVKKDKDILRFSCKEILGVSIANMAGVVKVTYDELVDGTGAGVGGDHRLGNGDTATAEDKAFGAIGAY